MPSLTKITKFLNKSLKTKRFKEYSRNGLQVKANKSISKIAFAVDASLETFKKAKKAKCDLIIVHHGLLWKGQKDELDLIKQRKQYLKDNNISLYASHLPLDRHNKLGNNKQLADIINLTSLKRFGKDHGYTWGFEGRCKRISLNNITRLLESTLHTKCLILPFGKNKIQKIGIVSGGGSFSITEAVKKNLDLLITGEISHSRYHFVKESNINVIAAGHYATETLGVKALKSLIKENFDVKTVFIDSPTKL